jgi:rhodanese-related sulfurtransferase
MPRSRHTSAKSPRTRKPQGGRRPRWTNLQIGSIAALIVVIAAGAYLLLRPRGGLPSEVQASQAYAMYQAGATFVDVRTQAEWDQGHIARSLLIPLDELPNRLNELPRDKDIVVVCRSGTRSKEGATVLRQARFARVTCLSGGLQAWVTAGYPIEQ